MNAPTDDFYATAIERAEGDAAALVEARAIEGLDEEVALLRFQIRRSIELGDADPKVLQAGVRLLIQALLAQHRLSPRQADHLGAAVANVLEEFGEALGTAR